MAWTKPLLRAKGRALALHMGISALILIPFAILIAFYWFPSPFFVTDGGWQGLRIMLFVDMVIGPALTFLVFNPAKSLRELKLDFGFIALVQAAALTYGCLNVDSQRPWAVVFSEGEFVVVTKDRRPGGEGADETWASLQPGPPYWVYARPPKDLNEQLQRLSLAMNNDVAPHEQIDTYQPLSAHMEDLVKHSRVPVGIVDFDAQLQGILQDAGLAVADVVLLALSGYYRSATLVLARDDGRRLGVIYHDLPSHK